MTLYANTWKCGERSFIVFPIRRRMEKKKKKKFNISNRGSYDRFWIQSDQKSSGGDFFLLLQPRRKRVEKRETVQDITDLEEK